MPEPRPPVRIPRRVNRIIERWAGGSGASGRFPGRILARQECRYLVKDFGTSQSPKSTRQRDSSYCPDR
ncbi:MAG: hypothetical protein AB2814_00690, partial [Candidatus Sedimenticola endophacoides]